MSVESRNVFEILPGVTVEIDPAHNKWNLSQSGWVCSGLTGGAVGSYVRVMSQAAGGQIRAYVLSGKQLWLQGPDYAGQWPELDALVQARCGALVVPYAVAPGGAVSYLWHSMSAHDSHILDTRGRTLCGDTNGSVTIRLADLDNPDVRDAWDVCERCVALARSRMRASTYTHRVVH